MKLSEIDLNNLDTWERGTPHEQFRLLRAEDPVHRHAGGPGQEDYWCITRHTDVKRVSRDPETFSSEAKGTVLRDPEPATLDQLRQIMLNMDPPRHRQYRAIVNKGFTPRMVKKLEPAIDALVERIIDDVCERGECDFVDEIASIMPMEVICEMMGVPHSDRRAIYELGNKMVGFDDPELNPEGLPSSPSLGGAQQMQASIEMFLYASKLKELYTREPADNLVTALLHAEVDGHRLSDLEFNSFFLLLAIAGNETTRTVTSNGMLALMRHPDQQAKLARDRSLVPSAVEEMLRFDPAVHSFRRTALRDSVIGDVEVVEGDKIIMWYPSANRDEEVFDEPDSFDVTRSPNDHLAFGIGEHFCLGSHLARLELRKIFDGLMRRLPDMQLAAEPRRLRSNFVNGVKEMRVRFTPTRRVGKR